MQRIQYNMCSISGPSTHFPGIVGFSFASLHVHEQLSDSLQEVEHLQAMTPIGDMVHSSGAETCSLQVPILHALTISYHCQAHRTVDAHGAHGREARPAKKDFKAVGSVVCHPRKSMYTPATHVGCHARVEESILCVPAHLVHLRMRELELWGKSVLTDFWK